MSMSVTSRVVSSLWLFVSLAFSLFSFFNYMAPTEIYTLSLHDALPIWRCAASMYCGNVSQSQVMPAFSTRSEEHTSELQSPMYLVCRLLLEKKNGKPKMEGR